MRRLGLLVVFAACGGGGEDPPNNADGPEADGPVADAPDPDGPAVAFALTSTAFAEGGTIPMTHTCNGANTSPQLAWTGDVPAGTLSFAMVLTDKTPTDFIHSVIYDIPPDRIDLPADIDKVFAPPDVPGAHQTKSFNNGPLGYRGPCPPSLHTYEFAVYALNVAALPDLNNTSTAAAGLAQILMHDLAVVKLTGTYDQP